MSKYGLLTPVQIVPGYPRQWECICDCGKTVVVRQTNLRTGHTTSCGCSRKGVNRTHGMSKTSTSKSWEGMRQRCYNPNNNSYHRYGGRGITVCERWRESFENFLEDMGPAPEGHSIERKDNNGNYEPDNCRWANKREQSLNRRTSRLVTAHGRTLTIKEWADLCGLPYLPLYKKFRRRGFPTIDPGLIPQPKDAE